MLVLNSLYMYYYVCDVITYHVLYIHFDTLFFSPCNSGRKFNISLYLALVALKLLVSLISRLVACSPRMVVATHTDRHTHRHTERVTTTVTLAAHARRGLISVCYAI